MNTTKPAASNKLATLACVKEYTEGGTVEIWLNHVGRAVVRAYNECGNNYTEVDLVDLLLWAREPNMSEEGSPLYQTLNEINKAACSGLPLLAIAMCVALPDICVSLSSDDGRTNGPRYREWCKKNLKAEHFGAVTPDDLWSMRCGVLHNGRFGDLKHNVGRVIFLACTRFG